MQLAYLRRDFFSQRAIAGRVRIEGVTVERSAMRGLGDEHAGRGGAPAGRVDVDDDRDLAGDDALHDLAHRVVQPARRVDLDDDRLGADPLGVVNAALDISGDGWRDRHS